jgi:hypothetical protein
VLGSQQHLHQSFVNEYNIHTRARAKSRQMKTIAKVQISSINLVTLLPSWVDAKYVLEVQILGASYHFRISALFAH